MTKRTLARSELEIARVVWNLGEATVRQVADALPAERGIGFWTVQTYRGV
jgi:BlaI family penicillinase repressor